VLDGLEKISICVGYDNPESDSPEPVYEELPGWKEATAKVKTMGGLPANARAYLERIESICEVKVDFVSTGPDREDTIILNEPFG
jgi:adenylosuccinate synthase